MVEMKKTIIIFALAFMAAWIADILITEAAFYDDFSYFSWINTTATMTDLESNFTVFDTNITGYNSPKSWTGIITNYSYFYQPNWCYTCNLTAWSPCYYGTSKMNNSIARNHAKGVGAFPQWEGYSCSCGGASMYGIVDMGWQINLKEIHLYSWIQRRTSFQVEISADNLTYVSLGNITYEMNNNYQYGNLTGDGDRIYYDLIWNSTMSARYIKIRIWQTEWGSCDFAVGQIWAVPLNNDTMFNFSNNDKIVFNTTNGNMTVYGANFSESNNIRNVDQRCIFPVGIDDYIYLYYNKTCSYLNFSLYSPWNNSNNATFYNIYTENTEPPIIYPDLTLYYETTFCYNEEYLYKKTKDIASDGSALFNEYLIRCDYGCSNSTLLNFGHPGCKASQLEQFILLVFICAIIIIFYKVATK